MRNLLIIGFFFVLSQSIAQEPFVKHNFSSLDSLQQVEPRPAVVFIHTDWCKYCKGMESKVFTDPEVAEVIAKNYYFIDLDAEKEAPVEFRGHTFKFKPTGRSTGVHELAIALGMIDGGLNYPTLVVLSPEYEILFQYGAFMNKRKLMRVLSNFKKPAR